MSVLEYLIKREQQELKAALKSSDWSVRQLHLEMANAYTFRIEEMKRLERMSPAMFEATSQVLPLNPERHEESYLDADGGSLDAPQLA